MQDAAEFPARIYAMRRRRGGESTLLNSRQVSRRTAFKRFNVNAPSGSGSAKRERECSAAPRGSTGVFVLNFAFNEDTAVSIEFGVKYIVAPF